MKAGNRRFAILVLVVLGCAGCAPQVVGIYNPNQLPARPTTFYVYPYEAYEALTPEQQELNTKLEEIVVASLESRGLQKSSLADLYISFIVNIHTAKESVEQPFNYYDYRYYNYLNPNTIPTQSYKQGVFIIDIKNAENKLVWQGNKTFTIKSRESVREILPGICDEVINSLDLSKL